MPTRTGVAGAGRAANRSASGDGAFGMAIRGGGGIAMMRRVLREAKPRMARSSRIPALVTALVAWGALVGQYALVLGMMWRDTGPWLATLRFFSFFTVLSNMLVALVATFALIGARSRIGRWFLRASVRGCASLCIAVTALVYFLLLRMTWSPTGLQWLVDKALHYATPALYLCWWGIWQRHGALRWSDPLRWLLFPACFLGWTLLHGAVTHWYPYPFLDVDALGYGAALADGLGIGALFVGLGLCLVAIDRGLGRRAGANGVS